MGDKNVAVSGQIQDVLKEINMNLRHIMIKELNDDALTMHQLFILKIIKEHPKMNLTTLGNHMNLAKSSMSLTVKKLVDEGYVLREEDTEDRRNKYIALSKEGEKVLKKRRLESKQLFSRLLTSLSDDELLSIREHLLILNQAIVEATEQMD